MSNPSYKNNTLIVVTEDDTQNGNNGPDHVSNTYRVPLVVIGVAAYMKQHYVSHVAYTTSNVLAAMERVMQNVHSGIIDPNDNLGLATFPMTTADQAALGDPLEDFWVQGTTPLSATAVRLADDGQRAAERVLHRLGPGGTAPYTYSWNFGDGSATSTAQNPSHTYSAAGTYTATLTVTDSSSPAKTATSIVTTKVSAVGNPLAATASATPTSGQIPLNVAFTGTGTGGTPPYSLQLELRRRVGGEHGPEPQPHLQHRRDLHRDADGHGQLLAGARPPPRPSPITATPIAGTPPGAPTGLTATAGNGQVSLNWTAPASNGGAADHLVPGVPRHVERQRDAADHRRLQRPRRGDSRAPTPASPPARPTSTRSPP